ncbi:hypothetical protein LguiB_032055 [Lonicera macranthoides]
MDDSDSIMVEDTPKNPNPLLSNTFNNNSNNVWRIVKPFANGGLAGVLTTSQAYLGFLGSYNLLLHMAESSRGPDYAAQIKSQLHSKHPPITFILKRFPALLLLQATYTTARLGSFEVLTRRVEAANGGRPLTLYQEACCGLTSGAIGAYIGLPFLAIIHMRTNASKQAAQQLNYRNVFHEVYQTVTANGVSGILKGTSPAMNVIMALNMGMLASYNRSFSYLHQSLGFSEWRAKLGAGFASGFFASACGLPISNVYTIMRTPDANGKYLFTSFLDTASTAFKIGGPSIFFKGFVKYFARNTPNIMVITLSLSLSQYICEQIDIKREDRPLEEVNE